MATLNKEIYNILNISSHGKTPTSEPISEEQVKFWIETNREVAINTIYPKDRYRMDQMLYQKTGCLDLTSIDAAECPCEEIVWGCNVFYVDIPKVVDLHGLPLLSVSMVDGLTPIQVLTPSQIQLYVHDKWTGSRPRCYIDASVMDNMIRLYVITADSDLQWIKARGVFSDPTMVVTNIGAPGNCVERCFDWDADEYPMSGIIRSTTYKLILEKELNMTMVTFQDILNNNRMDKAVTALKQELEMIDIYGKKANAGTTQTSQGRTRGVR
jgi:hypothetical protein